MSRRQAATSHAERLRGESNMTPRLDAEAREVESRQPKYPLTVEQASERYKEIRRLVTSIRKDLRVLRARPAVRAREPRVVRTTSRRGTSRCSNSTRRSGRGDPDEEPEPPPDLVQRRRTDELQPEQPGRRTRS